MNNKELELEAVKYRDLNLPDDLYDALYDAYIAGATSKWVEKQKLEFAIEQLKSLGQVHDESVMSERTRNKIKELEQKLNKL